MLLLIGLLNAVDLSFYALKRMDVENAAEIGAQAAWKACSDSAKLPATLNCSGLNAAITTAIQATSLGTSVSLASGYPSESYYCVDSSNALQPVGSLSSKPADCSSVGNASTSPGDYVQVQVTYPYKPLFGLTVLGASGLTSISMTSWMRLG
ncbi:MAG: hypothetical protein JSS54_16100 [Proteobacteria bacterium]|nr:hypothetical protein [Pseudomonadota bacterium]MBS0270479.1 hypothetical protein [Pseudomonadota bacterium]